MISGYSLKTCRPILTRSGMKLARPRAYFCQKCVTEQQDIHGFSYWHREHQIPGALWCSKHMTPFNYVNNETAFLFPPAFFLKSAFTVDKNLIAIVQPNPAIQKFLQLSKSLMNRDKPLDNKSVTNALKTRAIEMRLLNSGGTQKDRLFSDIVLGTFNLRWLYMTLPPTQIQNRSKFRKKLDMLFYNNERGNSASIYILAASVLYESAEDASNSLLGNI